MQVKLRALTEADALVSYKWRNNPIVWKYTGKRPDQEITPEIELKWIKDVLSRPDEVRYAIIADDSYVGNIQLTNLSANDAEFHIFIGETSYWGKGIATKALTVFLDKIKKLNLKKIYLTVNKDNTAAVKLYKKVGFHECSQNAKTLYMEKLMEKDN